MTNQHGVVIKEESWPPSSNIKPTRKALQISKVHLQVAIKDRVPDTVSELGRVKKTNSRVSSASWAIPCEYYYKARTQHRPGVVTATVVVYPSTTIPLDITLVTKDDIRIISTVAVLHFKAESELKNYRGSQWCLENDEDYVFPIADQIEAFVPDAEHENVPPVYHELRMVYEHARTIIRPDHEVELIMTVSLEDFQESVKGILKTLGFPPRESSVCSQYLTLAYRRLPLTGICETLSHAASDAEAQVRPTGYHGRLRYHLHAISRSGRGVGGRTRTSLPRRTPPDLHIFPSDNQGTEPEFTPGSRSHRRGDFEGTCQRQQRLDRQIAGPRQRSCHSRVRCPHLLTRWNGAGRKRRANLWPEQRASTAATAETPHV